MPPAPKKTTPSAVELSAAPAVEPGFDTILKPKTPDEVRRAVANQEAAMAALKTTDARLVVEVELGDMPARVIRVLRVPGDMKLNKFHKVLQVAFGWTNSHMHRFDNGEESYAPDTFDPWDDDGTLDEKKVTLAHAIRLGGFTYEYDFGDGWVHRVILIGLERAESAIPACLYGENACPPDDCGGPPGYVRLIKIMAKPKHPEYKDMAEWLGASSFDPLAFDMTATNRALAKAFPIPKAKAKTDGKAPARKKPGRPPKVWLPPES